MGSRDEEEDLETVGGGTQNTPSSPRDIFGNSLNDNVYGLCSDTGVNSKYLSKVY